jgi:hypothetical protein
MTIDAANFQHGMQDQSLIKVEEYGQYMFCG